MVKSQSIPDSICFSGVTHTGMHCDLCLSVFHLAAAWGCSLVGNQDPDMLSHLQTLESNVLTITSHPLQQQGLFPHGRMPPEVFRNWNAGKYRLAHCYYKHACRVCGGPASAFACYDHTLSMHLDLNSQPVSELHAGLGALPSLPGNCHFGPGSFIRSSHICLSAQLY